MQQSQQARGMVEMWASSPRGSGDSLWGPHPNSSPLLGSPMEMPWTGTSVMMDGPCARDNG